MKPKPWQFATYPPYRTIAYAISSLGMYELYPQSMGETFKVRSLSYPHLSANIVPYGVMGNVNLYEVSNVYFCHLEQHDDSSHSYMRQNYASEYITQICDQFGATNINLPLDEAFCTAIAIFEHLLAVKAAELLTNC